MGSIAFPTIVTRVNSGAVDSFPNSLVCFSEQRICPTNGCTSQCSNEELTAQTGACLLHMVSLYLYLFIYLQYELPAASVDAKAAGI